MDFFFKKTLVDRTESWCSVILDRHSTLPWVHRSAKGLRAACGQRQTRRVRIFIELIMLNLIVCTGFIAICELAISHKSMLCILDHRLQVQPKRRKRVPGKTFEDFVCQYAADLGETYSLYWMSVLSMTEYKSRRRQGQHPIRIQIKNPHE